MNRDKRRAAVKSGRSSGPSPVASTTPAAAIAALFAGAVRHHQAGRLLEAEDGYRRVLGLQAHRADVLFNLAVVLRQRGLLKEAADTYRQVVARDPNYAEAHFNLGNTLMALRQCGEAIAAYRKAIAIKPDYGAAYGNLGHALSALGAHGESATVFRRALEIDPARADLHDSLGTALKDQGQHEAAVAAYRQAISLKPGYAEAHYNLGNALKELGQLDAAVSAYRAAIASKPQLAEAHSNLGNVLSEQGRLDEAVAAYRQALAVRPAGAELHFNLGNALKDLGALEQAASAYRTAVALRPDYADAHGNLAIVLMSQGRLADARAEYRRVLDLAPDNAEAHSNWLLCLNYCAELTAEEVFAAHREWDARFGCRAARIPAYANDRTPARRLKVGYVSPDFRVHSAAYFIEPLLQAYDRQAVEMFCYAEVAKPDSVTARLQGLADHWVSTIGMADDALVARIQSDGIDILVDCAGHTAHNRLKAFARKPAPVQATWLGYPNTTGLSAIDYRLVDAVTDPVGLADGHASERLLRLPRGFLCYAGAEDAPEPAPPPCLSAGTVTFGSFNNPAKLSPATLDAWARLLARLPTARLLLKGKPFADEATRAVYLARLGERGVAAERVEMSGWLAGGANHLALYDRVDIALDPFPYNGTTTTCEALWMGVPVVTLRGDRHCGRVGASLLGQIGADDWVAGSVNDYVALAATLAADQERLRALRSALRSRVANSPLCDRAAFAHKIEVAYRQMWRDWCAARPA